MLSINVSELIWTVINFFLLLFLLKRFLYDPIIRFTEERQARINAGFEAERRAKETVQANQERLDAEKAERRREARHLLQAAETADGQRSLDAAARARQEAAQARQEMQEKLDAQRAAEEETLAAEKAALAALLAERLLTPEE